MFLFFEHDPPQPHSFNAGRWEDLEKEERTLAQENAKVIVTCGSVGKQDSIGEDHVIVPKFMWKVIYVPSTKKYFNYIFPDSDDVTAELSHYAVDLSQVEKIARVTFTNGVVEVAVKGE